MSPNTIRDLQESRGKKIAEMRQITDDMLANGETPEKLNRFNALDAEARNITTQIDNAEKLAGWERDEARSETVSGNAHAPTLQGYSLSKALSEHRSGGQATGLEGEWHQELSKGREVRGLMAPTEYILPGETRALITTGTAGNLVSTDLAAMTDRRRAALKMEMMGATILRSLTGNLDLPRLTGSGTAGWVAEHTDSARSDATFAKKSMAPKTVTAEYELSRRMLLQSNQALEPILRADLGYMLAQALDGAALRGGGTNEPTGILADTDVLTVTGGVFTSDITADLIAALETDNVTGTTGFLTNTGVMNAARKIKDADGRVIPLAELFHGERVESSTQVPDDIGTGSDKNALIYGEWASLYIGYWSGVDLLINPYHADVASKGGALLHAFLDADVVVRHPEGFRYAEID
ncbi:MAG TPA: phage major capsid protein [Octadecabacter sp.]|nr:phage major capsid protein [Octadecabacter sp.]